MTSGARAPKCNMEEKLFFLSAQNILLYTVILRLSFLYKIMYYLLCKRILLVMLPYFFVLLADWVLLNSSCIIIIFFFFFLLIVLVLYSSSRFTHLVNHLKFYYHRISVCVLHDIIIFPFEFLLTFTDYETSWQKKERARKWFDGIQYNV